MKCAKHGRGLRDPLSRLDGVLHPARAVMGNHGPELTGGGSLFMWADGLTELLAEHSHVKIVLSTSWARHLPFE